ncbi:hypothetical protein [Streptomyces sp. SP17KL33]|uniref:hypothetical protein n=1 Tax=Streptomyces sp. SP17KL33 TaxID=3002534 RepID=UPI002E792515|nr:hypothetical protein [Streptomyces sp. SP17KL33]MEE1829690.1 hypothetical protein [Streptomyces sp. SP17KL33]
MRRVRPALICPLPITLPPFPGECESSYWNRLALANRVPLARLRSPSHWLQSRLTSLDVHCILSGQSRQVLAKAIPDLRANGVSPTTKTHAPTPDHVLRWACRRCVAARTGSRLPAQVWASVHDNVCIRHKLWIGKNVIAPERQLDVSAGPDIVRAQNRYWRLRRRHGPAVTDICEDATARLWRGLAQRHYRLSLRAELLNLARTMSTTDPDRAAPWLLAAGYPERVALIGLFASAPWRQLAASDDLLAFADAMAEFDRRFPTKTPLRGTSRTWLGKTIASSATHIEALLADPKTSGRASQPRRTNQEIASRH